MLSETAKVDYLVTKLVLFVEGDTYNQKDGEGVGQEIREHVSTSPEAGFDITLKILNFYANKVHRICDEHENNPEMKCI